MIRQRYGRRTELLLPFFFLKLAKTDNGGYNKTMGMCQ